MKLTNCVLNGFSLMGITVTGGFHETDENVISIINDVMNPRDITGKEMIAKDFQRVGSSFISGYLKMTDGE